MVESAPSGGGKLCREDLKKAIDLCRDRVGAGERAYAQTMAMYQPLFGPPPAFHPGGGELALRAAEKDFFDSDLRKLLFTPERGLFARKPKAADYFRFCRSAQMLVAHYSELMPKLEQQLAVLEDAGQKLVDKVRLGMEKARFNVGTEGWDSYPQATDASKELYIGDLEVPVEPEAVCNLKDLGIVETDLDIAWLQLPFTYNVYQPFSVMISYEGETREGELKLGNIIRSLMYQIIRTMPPYSYEFVYLDPMRSGSTLRELLTELGAVVDGNAYQLHEKLYPDSVYRMLTVASDKEQVREQLKKLERRIADINSICGGQSVMQFNAPQFDEDGNIKEDNIGVLPQVFVFWEDVHGVLDPGTTEILQKLAIGAASAGISLIVTSVRERGKSLTDEELLLLKEDQLRDDFDHIEILPNGCSLYIDADALGEATDKNLFFNFRPRLDDICRKEYLYLVNERFKPALTTETGYAQRLDLDAVWGQSNGDKEIRIPVGVNLRDKVTYIELGGSRGAHALLAGSTGCGKSSYLHTIIHGVLTHYKPTDVQLWLSDYKTAEFKRYMVNTPAHVAYVGVARSREYTMSFIDRIYDEYNRRVAAFGTCTSIAEYRRHHGADSMPRIFIIVDEFHKMSNHIKDFPDYKMKLAELLREMRAMGMTFLLADQTCGTGLQGLSDDAMLQLTCRMAMKTTDAEYNAVFNITNAKDVIQTQDVYEVTLQRMVTQQDSLGKVTTRCYYERNKTLFVNESLRDEIAVRCMEAYGPAREPFFVEEKERIEPDWAMINREEGDDADDCPNGISMCLGTPLSLERYFRFTLAANYGENIVNVVQNQHIFISIFATQFEIFSRQENSELYVMADENNSLYGNVESWLREFGEKHPNVHIVTYIGDICDAINTLQETVNRRRRMKTYHKIGVFWIGLEDIAYDMSYLPDARPNLKRNQAKQSTALMQSASDLSLIFDSLFDDVPTPVSIPDPEPEYEEDDSCYNAAEDITEIMSQGPKRGIHHFCYYTSVNVALQTKCAPLTGQKAAFRHKIALQIGKEDAMDFFGRSGLAVDSEGNPLADDVAVYYDGRNAIQYYPFLSKVELDRIEKIKRKKQRSG